MLKHPHSEAQAAEKSPQPRLRVNYLGIFCGLGLPAFVCMFAIQALIYGFSFFIAISSIAVALYFVTSSISFANSYICEFECTRKTYIFIGILSLFFTIFNTFLTFKLLSCYEVW